MRQRLAAVLMILLLLAGCSRSDAQEQTALALRTALQGASGCRFVSLVHAACDERLYDFTLDYESGKDRRLTVTAPENIAGISATVSEPSGELQFDGVILSFGTEQAAASPLMLPWLMETCMRSAYIAYTADSEQGTAIRYYYGYDDSRLEVEVVVDRTSLTPLTCEVFQDGRALMSAEISDFVLTSDT